MERGRLPLFSGDRSSGIVRKVTECTHLYSVSQAYLCCVERYALGRCEQTLDHSDRKLANQSTENTNDELGEMSL